MRNAVLRSTLVAVLATIGLAAVSHTSANAAATYRVLITGDSITQGSSGDYTWRYRLWNKLATTEPGNVAFVGTRTDLYDNVNDAYGSQYYAASFSAKSHSAKWGDTFVNELGNIAGQVTSSNANVLVVMLGSNDLAYQTSPAQTVANLSTYIQRARNAKPGIDVVVGEVLNRYDPWTQTYSLNSETSDYANRIQTLASQLNTSSERVVVAPTRTGWDAKVHTWDGTHPNPTGEALIAQRISQGLAQVGVGSSSPDVSGSKSWSVAGPTVSLTPGSEQISLGWNRAPSGATGMLVEMRLTNINEAWHRLPYAVGGSGWTAESLAAGGNYQIRLVPSKGTNTGLSGPANSSTATGPTPGTIGSVNASAGPDSSLGGVTANTSWSAAANASGYYLSNRTMSNGSLAWDDLPYAVEGRSWKFEPLAPGRRMQFRMKPVRGFLEGSWKSSTTTRMRGLPGNRVYAALGDSYSSGLGSEQGIFDDACEKATHAWAYQMQPAFQSTTSLLACEGKTTAHVKSTQIPQMQNLFDANANVGKPQLVTMTVGGNNVHFTDQLKDCLAKDCTSDETSKWNEIDGVASELVNTYNAVQAAAPYADIIVGGYPWVVEPGGPSNNILCQRLSESERQMVTRLSTHLNDVIASSAHTAGVWTVGNAVRSQFVGHNACTGGVDEWIHAGNLDIGGEGGLGLVDKKSFHPKDAGQLAYAIAFSNSLIALSQ